MRYALALLFLLASLTPALAQTAPQVLPEQVVAASGRPAWQVALDVVRTGSNAGLQTAAAQMALSEAALLGNMATVLQTGIGNSADVTQSGLRNLLLLEQWGNGNSSQLIQQGNDNQIQLIVRMDGLTKNVAQIGNGNVYSETFTSPAQSGLHTILQVGNGKPAGPGRRHGAALQRDAARHRHSAPHRAQRPLPPVNLPRGLLRLPSWAGSALRVAAGLGLVLSPLPRVLGAPHKPSPAPPKAQVLITMEGDVALVRGTFEHDGSAAALTFQLSVSKTSGGGTSRIQQAGAFTPVTGQRDTLGMVRINVPPTPTLRPGSPSWMARSLLQAPRAPTSARPDAACPGP